MQVDPRKTLLDQIDAAFEAVAAPPSNELLVERYRRSHDPKGLAAAFHGRHWTAVPPTELFRHRGSLCTLTAVGYRAYIGAYMKHSLFDGPYAADLREYTLFSMRPRSDSTADVAEARARLAKLDTVQRTVIGRFVSHLAEASREAQRVLTAWNVELS